MLFRFGLTGKKIKYLQSSPFLVSLVRSIILNPIILPFAYLLVLSTRNFVTDFMRNSVMRSERDAVILNGLSVLSQRMSKNFIPDVRSKVYCKKKSS